jgi:MFS transporter, UMF1 family
MIRKKDIFIEKGNKKTIQGWVMYDWSNSVYQLTISSAIFPVYYNSVTHHGNNFTIDFFGLNVINTVMYSWAIAFAYLFVALLSPFFSSIADFTGRRKLFMQMFTWIGAFACGSLFFFDAQHIELGIIALTIGTIGYGGSLVFYNSFLPVIAAPSEQDRVSARGYSMGYFGSVVLLILNLIPILFPDFFGITDPTLAPRISFVMVFLWWLGFSQITFSRLPKFTLRQRNNKGENVIFHGYKELRKVFNYVKKSRQMSIFLIGFFFTTMGLLTVMFMAATFGQKELHVKDTVLIPVILVIQLVGVGGAYFFSWLSTKIGNLKALIIGIIGWILICMYVYTVTATMGFIIAAVLVGIVMGGTQSLARSTYSKMLPETKDHTSFFSFYDVMEKIATVAGLFSFGIIEAITGSMRNSVLAIISFFVLGMIFLLFVPRIKPTTEN